MGPTCASPLSLSPFFSKLHPTALASALVKSPSTRMWIEI
jgi:hypothetical protein